MLIKKKIYCSLCPKMLICEQFIQIMIEKFFKLIFHCHDFALNGPKLWFLDITIQPNEIDQIDFNISENNKLKVTSKNFHDDRTLLGLSIYISIFAKIIYQYKLQWWICHSGCWRPYFGHFFIPPMLKRSQETVFLTKFLMF